MARYKSQFSGINGMSNRLGIQGGDPQQDRMIHDKRWTLDHATKYSYQAAKIKRLDENNKMPALMNPNKLKQDYDDKVLSIGFEYGFQPGEVFEWCNTDTKWLIYLQDLTELAYFRGDVRRCSYEVNWKDDDGTIHTTYLAVRGPVETKINYIQKNGTSVDNPNYSINFLMPKNEHTLAYFKRYSRFYLKGLEDGMAPVCWRVEAVDNISMKGIININAVEYYANEAQDDIEKGIADAYSYNPALPVQKLMTGKPLLKAAKTVEPINYIEGQGLIKPGITYTYTYTGVGESHWKIEGNAPVKYSIKNNTISIKWLKTFSGKFTISNNDSKKTIIVESLM